jgi:hypothetical protein
VEAVSLISVALSSIIALAAIGAGVWQQRQRLNHERETVDRESVRSTLAETAAILHRAEYAIDEVNAALMGHAATMFDPAHPERAESVTGLEMVVENSIGRSAYCGCNSVPTPARRLRLKRRALHC